jgi:hypothetical protein
MPTGYVLAAAAMTAPGSSVAASTLLVDYPVFSGQAIRYGLAAVILVALARGHCSVRICPSCSS